MDTLVVILFFAIWILALAIRFIRKTHKDQEDFAEKVRVIEAQAGQQYARLTGRLLVLEAEVLRLTRIVGEAPVESDGSTDASAGRMVTMQPLELLPDTLESEPPAAIAPPDPLEHPTDSLVYAAAPAPLLNSDTIHPEPEQPEVPTVSRTRAEWETLIGGQWLNRIGALALFMGMAFFLKYAFDNNWLTEPMRVTIGGLVGAALLVAGARFTKSGLLIFAQGLVGAGIAILYLSVFALFNFYHLVPQFVAFALMSGVTLLAFQQAIRYDSFAIAILAWTGGFFTPVMLNTGEANEIGLFTYVALLDTGLILILMHKKAWRLLEPLTVGATYLIYQSWFENAQPPVDLTVTVFFLSVFWGLFFTLDNHRVRHQVTEWFRTRRVLAGLNAVFYYLAVYLVVEPEYPQGVVVVTLMIGTVYTLAAFHARRSSLQATVVNQYAVTAAALLVLATVIYFDGFTLECWLSIEALAVATIGTRLRLKGLWGASLVLIALSVIVIFLQLLTQPYTGHSFVPVFNERMLAFGFLAVAMGGTAVLMKRVGDPLSETIGVILHCGWCLILFMWVSQETKDVFAMRYGVSVTPTRAFSLSMILGITWMTFSLALNWGSTFPKSISPVVGCALVFAGIAVMIEVIRGAGYQPVERFIPIFNLRAGSVVFLIGGLMLHASLLERRNATAPWTRTAQKIVLGAIPPLLLFLLSVETWDYYQRSINRMLIRQDLTELNRLENLQQLALSGVWLGYAILLMGAGLWKRLIAIRVMAILFFAVTILKIFIYDLSFLTALYRIFSFMGLGVILLVVSYLYQRFKGVVFEDKLQEEVQ